MTSLTRCMHVWRETLKRFGVDRNVTLREENAIARALLEHGAESVELALYGAGFEPRTDKFDPTNYVNVNRIFQRDAKGKSRFEDFLNWGARQRSKDKQARDNRRALDATISRETQEEWAEQDPAKVREIINRMKGMPV